MRSLYNNLEYVNKLKAIKDSFKTYYALGAFGAPATEKNKSRYKVPNAPSDAFLFDCSGFAYRALPWGWVGNKRVYGGAVYPTQGDEFYPLTTGDICSISLDVSKDFSKILPGEVLYMKGHVGIYVGDGVAIECTSAGTNNVQLSEVKNVGISTGLKLKRTWLKHAKLPFIEYMQNAITQEDEYYIVKPGDNLTKIARMYDVNIWTLARVNHINNINLIRVGQKLVIPR